MPAPSKTPTAEAYGELQLAYDHFNRALFGGELPHCLITLQRKGQRTYGGGRQRVCENLRERIGRIIAPHAWRSK